MTTLEIKESVRRAFNSCKRQFDIKVSFVGIDADTIMTYAMNYLIWAEQRHVRDDMTPEERIELSQNEYTKHYSEMGTKVVSIEKTVDNMDSESASRMFELLKDRQEAEGKI